MTLNLNFSQIKDSSYKCSTITKDVAYVEASNDDLQTSRDHFFFSHVSKFPPLILSHNAVKWTHITILIFQIKVLYHRFKIGVMWMTQINLSCP